MNATKKIALALCISLVVFLGTTTRNAQAQECCVFNPLAVPFVVAGGVLAAAASVASLAVGGPVVYGPGPAYYRYGSGYYRYGSGYYRYGNGYYRSSPRYYRPYRYGGYGGRGWVPGHYNRYGDWVPGRYRRY